MLDGIDPELIQLSLSWQPSAVTIRATGSGHHSQRHPRRAQGLDLCAARPYSLGAGPEPRRAAWQSARR